MSKDGLIFNGIDGRSGTYLLPPFDISQLARMALGQRLPPVEARGAADQDGPGHRLSAQGGR